MATLLEMLQANSGPEQPSIASPALAQTAKSIQAMPMVQPTRERERRRGPSLLDTIWGVAAGYSPGDTRRRIETSEREIAMKERQMAAQAGLAGMFASAGAAPAVGASGGAAGGSSQMFDPRRVAPALVAAQAAGVDVAPYRQMLEMTRPDVEFINGVGVDKRDVGNIGQRRGGVDLQNVNGVLLDPNDPRNAGRYIPQAGEGQEIVYDAEGQPMIRAIPGYAQAEAGVEGAVTGARLDASNPRTLTTVTDSRGRPVTTSIGGILESGGIVGADPLEAQRKEQIIAQDIEREGNIITAGDAAKNTLMTLDNMERFLPDVISGIGSGVRLNAARALAAVGNDTAIREVQATQVFQNQARSLVMDIIKGFGANPSNAEREYAEKMQGADVSLTPETLREGIALGRARAQRQVQAADRVREGRSNGSGTPSREALMAEARRRGLL